MPVEPVYQLIYSFLFLQNLKISLDKKYPKHHFSQASKQPACISGDVVKLKIPKAQGWSILPNVDPEVIIIYNDSDKAFYIPLIQLLF